MEVAGCTSKQISRFIDCGSNCHLWHSPSLDRATITGNLCRSRHCKPCATARSRLIQSNLIPFCRNRRLRMLTVTLKHRERPLSTQITRIWRCFKTLRTNEEWKTNVVGFCAFLEVKRNPRSHTWHVHLHILTEGQYWQQKEISRLWLEATGDSMIVDIQSKGTSASMASYGAKYASKPIDAGDMETVAVHAEAIHAIGRRRLWLIGGTWKKHLKLLAHGDDPKDWQFVESANALFARAAAGDGPAREIVSRLVGDREHLPNSDTS